MFVLLAPVTGCDRMLRRVTGDRGAIARGTDVNRGVGGIRSWKRWRRRAAAAQKSRKGERHGDNATPRGRHHGKSRKRRKGMDAAPAARVQSCTHVILDHQKCDG
jgi:hypothetical protein